MFNRQKFVICRARASDFVRSDSGATEKLLEKLFDKAKMHLKEGPTLLLFDELGMYYILVE